MSHPSDAAGQSPAPPAPPRTDHPSHLSDDDLVHRVRQLVRASNEVTADLVVHLAEVDARKLFADQAYSSMFAWCVGELGLSEKATYKRIAAARHARRFPRLADELARGRLHLSGIVLIGPHLTETNAGELIEAACGKSCQRIEQLLADRSPRPDAPTRIRKLPAPARPAPPVSGAPPPAVTAPPPPITSTADPPAEPAGPALRQERQDRIEPLGAARYKVQFTASQELVDKLKQAQALLSHRVPDGDLSQVLDQALSLLNERLLKERFAIGADGGSEHDDVAGDPSSAPVSRFGGSRHIPNAIKREVVRRDGLRCTFVDSDGRRCEQTHFLEFHHRVPWG